MSVLNFKNIPTKYYFIQCSEGEGQDDTEDQVSLNGVGYLFIGYGYVDNENFFQELLKEDNTFFSIDAARSALNQIRTALKLQIPRF